SARYHIDIGPHVFPTRKYSLVHARLIEAAVIDPSDVVEPAPASWEDLARVHTAEYLAKMRDGTIDVAQLELPWSAEMVEAFRIMVGGTIHAARIASGLEVKSQKSEARKTGVAQHLSSDVAQDFSPAVETGSAICCHIRAQM